MFDRMIAAADATDALFATKPVYSGQSCGVVEAQPSMELLGWGLRLYSAGSAGTVPKGTMLWTAGCQLSIPLLTTVKW